MNSENVQPSTKLLRAVGAYLGRAWHNRSLYLMLLPATIFLLLFQFYPMWGIRIAFYDYNIFFGLERSEYVGLKWFDFVFDNPQTLNIIRNTVRIAVQKIFLGQLAAVVFALMVHEVKFGPYKRLVQTVTTLPHFLSWVIVGAVTITLLKSTGVVNQTLETAGVGQVGFLRDPGVFPYTLVFTDVWKGFGFGAIIYLAALTQIDPHLYEAAACDGAGRWASMRYITLPGIVPIIVLMAALSLGHILSAGFDQILVLYNPLVYETGDVLDTYVYRVGLIDNGYEIATVVGLFKGAVGFFLILTSYWLAARFANYRIF